MSERKMNLTGVYPNVARAYEIALLGNYSITITYSGDLFNYPQASEDYPAIKRFFEKVLFVTDGDLWVEMPNPKDYNRGLYSETLADIHLRVKKAKDNPEPNSEYCEASKELLKNAVNRLHFSLKDVEIINKVSSTIAKLDGEGKILTHHVAEAAQYRIKQHYDHPLIVAENDTIQFGNKIKIKKGEIAYEDAEKAIIYLKKML